MKNIENGKIKEYLPCLWHALEICSISYLGFHEVGCCISSFHRLGFRPCPRIKNSNFRLYALQCEWLHKKPPQETQALETRQNHCFFFFAKCHKKPRVP